MIRTRRRHVRDAHDHAVEAALEFAERHTVWSRRGHGGGLQVRGEGLIAAAFRHRTSRNGDPHLHTHVLVPNMVRGEDGTWATLDARWLYTSAKTIGYLYEAQLRHNLTVALGVDWTSVTNGIADIEGIPTDVLKAFSTRRAEIEERMAIHGQHSAKAAMIAALDTRRGKEADPGLPQLRNPMGAARRRDRVRPRPSRRCARLHRALAAQRPGAADDRGPDARARRADRARVVVQPQRHPASLVRRPSGRCADRRPRGPGRASRRPPRCRPTRRNRAREGCGDQRPSPAGRSRHSRRRSGGRRSNCSTSNAAPSHTALNMLDTGRGVCGEAELLAALRLSPTLSEEQTRAVIEITTSGQRGRHRHRTRRCRQDLRLGDGRVRRGNAAATE